MDYTAFVQRVELCRRAWDRFQASVEDEDLKKFLKESYPVLSSEKGQILLSEVNVYGIARSNPGFFIPNEAGERFVGLVKKHDDLKMEGHHRAEEEVKKLWERIRAFDLSQLRFRDYQLEIRFSSLRMDLIQRLKELSGVDKALTEPRRISIRVVLKV